MFSIYFSSICNSCFCHVSSCTIVLDLQFCSPSFYSFFIYSTYLPSIFYNTSLYFIEEMMCSYILIWFVLYLTTLINNISINPHNTHFINRLNWTDHDGSAMTIYKLMSNIISSSAWFVYLIYWYHSTRSYYTLKKFWYINRFNNKLDL